MLRFYCLIRQALSLVLTVGSFISFPVFAEDVLRRFQLTDGVIKRLEFSDLVLEEAMRRTVAKYGAYRVGVRQGSMGREEMLVAMLKGDDINVARVATQPSWELRLLPIYIPLYMGISNYRIALVTKEGQKRLEAVRSLDDLRALRVGAGSAWSSRRVMEIDGFNVHAEENFDRLLDALLADSIDYFPRGLNEVFVEYSEKSGANPHLIIDTQVLLEFPLPGYLFVSSVFPRLQKRLSEGLETMVQDGSLRRMVASFHADMLQRADLCSRKLLRINSPNLFNLEPYGASSSGLMCWIQRMAYAESVVRPRELS